MTRDELLAAGARAWHADSWRIDGDAVAAIIDAVEPLIRADERGIYEDRIKGLLHTLLTYRADLRAKVKALDDSHYTTCLQTGDSTPCTCPDVVAAVLALIDGNPDA